MKLTQDEMEDIKIFLEKEGAQFYEFLEENYDFPYIEYKSKPPVNGETWKSQMKEYFEQLPPDEHIQELIELGFPVLVSIDIKDKLEKMEKDLLEIKDTLSNIQRKENAKDFFNNWPYKISLDEHF